MPRSLPSTRNPGRTSLTTSSRREPEELHRRLLSIIQQQAQTAQQEKHQISELTSILVDLLSSRRSKMENSSNGHRETSASYDAAVQKDYPAAETLANALLEKSTLGDSDGKVPLYYKNGSEEKVAGYVPLEILEQLRNCRDCAWSPAKRERQVDNVSDPNELKESTRVERTDQEERASRVEDEGGGLGVHDDYASASQKLGLTCEIPRTEGCTSFGNNETEPLSERIEGDAANAAYHLAPHSDFWTLFVEHGHFGFGTGFPMYPHQTCASRFDDIAPENYPDTESEFLIENECLTEDTDVTTSRPSETQTAPDMVEYPLAMKYYVSDRKPLDADTDGEAVIPDNETSSRAGEENGQLNEDRGTTDEAALGSAEAVSGTLPDEEVGHDWGLTHDLKTELGDADDDAFSSKSSLSMRVGQSARSSESVKDHLESDFPSPPPWDVVVPVIPISVRNEDAVVPETFYPCRYDLEPTHEVEMHTPFQEKNTFDEENDKKVAHEEIRAVTSSIEDSPSTACASSGTSRVPSSQSSPVSPVSNRSSLFTPRSLLVKPVTPVEKRESISLKVSKKSLEPASGSDSGFSDERPVRFIRTEGVGMDNSTVYGETLLRKTGSGEMLNFFVTDIEKTFPACSLWIMDRPLSKQPKEVTRLNRKMTDFYSCRPWLSKMAKKVFVGQVVAVRWTASEWVRGRITTVGDDFIRITLIDMGGCINANIEETRPLHEQFFRPSALALRAEIAGLDPVQYDQDAAGRLITMLKNRTVQGTIICSSPTPVVRLFDFTTYQTPVEVTTLLFQDLLARPLGNSSLQLRREIRLGIVVKIPSSSASSHLILVDLKRLAQLENIQRAVENGSRAKNPVDKRNLDTIVAVEWHGVMFRAFILSVTKDHRVFVELFDYGHRFYTKLTNLYRIPSNVIDMPPVTLGCHIDRVEEHAEQSILQDRLKELLHKTVLYEILLTLGHQQVVIRLWDDKMELVENRFPEDSNFCGNLTVDKLFYPMRYSEHQMLLVKVACVYDSYSDLSITGVIVQNMVAPVDDSKRSQEMDHNETVESAEFMVDMQTELPKMPEYSLNIEENTFVCAYLKERNMWYRAIVYETKDVVNKNKPILYLIDIGQWESVPLRNVRPMRPEWIKEPWHSSLLHIHEFVLASFVDDHWAVRETLSLDQIEETVYRFIVTKLDTHILHGILIVEESHGHSSVS